jgi:hypothetical protein
LGEQSTLGFLADGGSMGARMRALDWTATPLGPPEAWPQSLKAVVRVMLTSRFAMWMAWGPELTFFCNDAYLPTTGIRRDWVLGARSDRVWAEIWRDIGPRIAHVLATGQATWDEALMLYLERSGFPEETYHTFSYSPLADDAAIGTDDNGATADPRRAASDTDPAIGTDDDPTDDGCWCNRAWSENGAVGTNAAFAVDALAAHEAERGLNDGQSRE